MFVVLKASLSLAPPLFTLRTTHLPVRITKPMISQGPAARTTDAERVERRLEMYPRTFWVIPEWYHGRGALFRPQVCCGCTREAQIFVIERLLREPQQKKEGEGIPTVAFSPRASGICIPIPWVRRWKQRPGIDSRGTDQSHIGRSHFQTIHTYRLTGTVTGPTTTKTCDMNSSKQNAVLFT